MWLVLLLVLIVVFIVVATTRWKLHPFLALLLAAFGYGILCRKMALAQVVESVNQGFGDTIGYIGIVILAGSVIGAFLEKSGGALQLARSMLNRMGRKNVPAAMSLIGYLVSIPVFCDSGFVILSPLAKSLARKAGISLAACVVALSLGLYATHTMVPPTPGPVAAANLLQADLGLVILWGALVSAIALAAGWFFAVKFASRVDIKIETEEKSSAIESTDKQAPSALISLVPILLPIVLIVLASVSKFPGEPLGQGKPASMIQFLGQPVVALLLGVFFSFLLPKKLTKEMLSSSGWVGQAVITAATIIIITGCGGALGKVLQNSGIADVLEAHLKEGTSLSIWLPFLLAAALKTAQGSSTVAIITTAGIVVSLLEPLGLNGDHARALAVVAIGAGAMVVSHANDSYFWVVTQLSGMSVKQGYKLQTLGTLVQGLAAAVVLWLIYLIIL
jgi:gluconate:H+ symporter, GntP family